MPLECCAAVALFGPRTPNVGLPHFATLHCSGLAAAAVAVVAAAERWADAEWTDG